MHFFSNFYRRKRLFDHALKKLNKFPPPSLFAFLLQSLLKWHIDYLFDDEEQEEDVDDYDVIWKLHACTIMGKTLNILLVLWKPKMEKYHFGRSCFSLFLCFYKQKKKDIFVGITSYHISTYPLFFCAIRCYWHIKITFYIVTRCISLINA